ncbi:SDR family NAD(P)-dependent oxidoreductase [Actinomadura scrupuli]|uniref:SDR family NAD(P)-dependent oxidoreductase n=1 Tax=Actinomadura scrupuli TaxID=559629 RepID=UPI003D958A9E
MLSNDGVIGYEEALAVYRDPAAFSSGDPVGRVAVVTGAASGIGLGVARHLAGQGHRVALLDQHGQAALQAAGERTSPAKHVNGGWYIQAGIGTGARAGAGRVPVSAGCGAVLAHHTRPGRARRSPKARSPKAGAGFRGIGPGRSTVR